MHAAWGFVGRSRKAQQYLDWEKSHRAIDTDVSEYIVQRKRRVRKMSMGPGDNRRSKEFSLLRK